MAGDNQFVRFADGAAANIEDIAGWVANTTLLSNGFSDGLAITELLNRAWRQGTTAMAVLGAHLAEVLNEDVLDDPASVIGTLWNQVWRTMLLQSTFIDVGSANAYLTSNPPGLSFPAPAAGTQITIFIVNTNTGASTYNHMGTGPLPLLRMDSSDVTRGEIVGGVTLLCSGPAWHVISASPSIIRANSFGTTVDTLTVGSGTYTVPAGVFLIQPVLIGAGGGSSGSATPGPNGAIAGAGGGGCCIGTPQLVAPGTGFSYVVGAGGVAVAYGATGGNGGTTTFNAGTLSAVGGTGSSFASVGFGGSASAGLFNLQGTPGNAYGGSSGGIGGSAAGPYGSGGGAAGTGIAADGGFPGGGAGGPGDGGAEAGKVGGNGVIYILR